jgi:hypothetical protein
MEAAPAGIYLPKVFSVGEVRPGGACRLPSWPLSSRLTRRAGIPVLGGLHHVYHLAALQP